MCSSMGKRPKQRVALEALILSAMMLTGLESNAQVITYPSVTPTSEVITEERRKALLLYKRLTGISTPIDNPKLVEMESLIRSDDLLGAAKIATAEPAFYNLTVRSMATKMSNIDETVRAPLNDFVATIVGVARDNLDARLLLHGNFLYQADTTVAANVRADPVADILRSNNHYADIDTRMYSLHQVLVRVDGQRAINEGNTAVAHPDPSGVLTSRGWMEAHAIAGTNRRPGEYTSRIFQCVDIETMSDTSGPDDMIGRDIDRFPGGTNEHFQVKCKGCHTILDGIRPAYAQFDFDRGYVKHASLLPSGGGEFQMRQSPVGISSKVNANADVFPSGFRVTNTAWVNNATRGLNAALFGWRGPVKGAGLNQFGKMVAESKRFSTCMAMRAFNQVCKRTAIASEGPMFLELGQSFEASGYSLRSLFEQVAIRKECIGN